MGCVSDRARAHRETHRECKDIKLFRNPRLGSCAIPHFFAPGGEEGFGGRGHKEAVGVVGGAEAVVFAFADVVVREEGDFVRAIRERREETDDGVAVGGVGVDAVDEGDADEVADAQLGDEADVVEDGFVGDARVAAVGGAVHMLEVDQEQLGGGGDGADDVGGGVERGVDGAVETAAAELPQERERVLRVHQRLAAAERHAAAAARHHVALFLDLGHQFVHRPLAAADFQGFGGAFAGAGAAEGARGARGADALGREGQGPLRAAVHAGGAADAAAPLVEPLRKRAPTLGVMTPDAAKRTTLQEKGGPDAGAVVDRIAFDVEDKSHCGERLSG